MIMTAVKDIVFQEYAENAKLMRNVKKMRSVVTGMNALGDTAGFLKNACQQGKPVCMIMTAVKDIVVMEYAVSAGDIMTGAQMILNAVENTHAFTTIA